MRLALARWLRRLARWVDPSAPDPIVQRARVLVHEQDGRWPDRDGEAKRHQVLSRLIKDHPTISKRVLARAIEDAL